MKHLDMVPRLKRMFPPQPSGVFPRKDSLISSLVVSPSWPGRWRQSWWTERSRQAAVGRLS